MLFGNNKIYLGDNLIVNNEASSTPVDDSVPIYKTVEGSLYRQIFVDDFNGKDIDRNYWTSDYNATKYSPWYTVQSDVYVENSICHIRIKEDAATLGGTSWAAGVSGIQTAMFNTTGGSNKYRPWYGLLVQEGYYELRCKIYSGGGTHMAWWMTGTGTVDTGNAEIDIFEIQGKDTSTIPMNLYDDTTSIASAQKSSRIGVGIDLSNDFHTYGFLWENGLMKFYLDGNEIESWTDITTPQYPLMTWITAYRCMSGSYWAGAHEEGLGDLELLVDYLKIYKKANTESETQPTVVDYTPISASVTAGNYTVDAYSGKISELPSYCYVNWSDGSRTEHMVIWEIFNDTKKNILDNGGTLEWPGVVYGHTDIEVIATITVS